MGTITIVIPEWFVFMLLIWLLLSLANDIMRLYINWLEKANNKRLRRVVEVAEAAIADFEKYKESLK